jgi:hypothetical protein
LALSGGFLAFLMTIELFLLVLVITEGTVDTTAGSSGSGSLLLLFKFKFWELCERAVAFWSLFSSKIEEASSSLGFVDLVSSKSLADDSFSHLLRTVGKTLNCLLILT